MRISTREAFLAGKPVPQNSSSWLLAGANGRWQPEFMELKNISDANQKVRFDYTAYLSKSVQDTNDAEHVLISGPEPFTAANSEVEYWSYETPDGKSLMFLYFTYYPQEYCERVKVAIETNYNPAAWNDKIRQTLPAGFKLYV